MNIFKSFLFYLPKNGAGADPKKSAPAPAKILNRLRLQPKKPRFRPAPAPQHWIQIRNTSISSCPSKLPILTIREFYTWIQILSQTGNKKKDGSGSEILHATTGTDLEPHDLVDESQLFLEQEVLAEVPLRIRALLPLSPDQLLQTHTSTRHLPVQY